MGVDGGDGGRYRLGEEMTVAESDVESVVPHVLLAGQYRSKLGAGRVSNGVSCVVEGEDVVFFVVGDEWGRFEKDDVFDWEVF